MNTRGYLDYLHTVSDTDDVQPGSPLPLGVELTHGGANFAVFSRHAARVWLELYDDEDEVDPIRTIELTAPHHRTGDIWHVWMRDIGAGQRYAYRVAGPYEPAAGHRFDARRLLIDPFATAISNRPWRFEDVLTPEVPQQSFATAKSNAAVMPKSIIAHDHFRWHGDLPPVPWTDTIIYETHVRGATVHPSSGANHPGTYRGLIEKLPYFVDLGITALELMPVQEFNETTILRHNPLTGAPLSNYWGYDPVGFIAPEGSYCSLGREGHQMQEFLELVDAYHRAGIEIIVDLVLNHTAEGNAGGPTFSLRGFDNSIYYMLDQNDRSVYRDYTGTGNTLNANHPVVRGFILNVLRTWVTYMRIDGVRFDLASVLGRDRYGNLLASPPLLEAIAEDPILREIKIIAEAWDAGGAYQVGSFSERRWAEWNGRYRDDVRRFWRGDDGMLGVFASRICGSEDIYRGSGKGPQNSINFITSHDGFTLNDLVSYARKHNEANGEQNRDGMDENFSANYGVEGPTDDPRIEDVRRRQIKNMLLTLFISRGVPMLLGGDEFRRTQQGNNNAYCQDNEISWVDWRLRERHAEIHRFTRGMIAFRRDHPVLRRDTFYTPADVRWTNPAGGTPDWADRLAKCLGCHVYGRDLGPDLFMIFNAATEPVTFVLPGLTDGQRWHRAVDTALRAPDDLAAPGRESRVDFSRYTLDGRSCAILLSRRPR